MRNQWILIKIAIYIRLLQIFPYFLCNISAECKQRRMTILFSELHGFCRPDFSSGVVPSLYVVR